MTIGSVRGLFREQLHKHCIKLKPTNTTFLIRLSSKKISIAYGLLRRLQQTGQFALLALTSRLPMAAGDVRNAEAIIFASNPTTTCNINGARTPASMAGSAQANISARRRSGISASVAAAATSLVGAARKATSLP